MLKLRYKIKNYNHLLVRRQDNFITDNKLESVESDSYNEDNYANKFGDFGSP